MHQKDDPAAKGIEGCAHGLLPSCYGQEVGVVPFSLRWRLFFHQALSRKWYVLRRPHESSQRRSHVGWGAQTMGGGLGRLVKMVCLLKRRVKRSWRDMRDRGQQQGGQARQRCFGIGDWTGRGETMEHPRTAIQVSYCGKGATYPQQGQTAERSQRVPQGCRA